MRGPTRSPRFLHLIRLDSARVHGWQMRLPLWHPLSVDGVEYTELFSDSLHGGDAKALVAARRRRDELFAQESLPLRLGGNTKHSRNSTGMVGVMLAFDGSRRGQAAFQWVALWNEGKVQHKKRFGVGTYGFDEALRMAIALREDKSGLVFQPAQKRAAAELREEVDYYVRTGKRLEREPSGVKVPPRVRNEETGQLGKLVRGPSRANRYPAGPGFDVNPRRKRRAPAPR